MFVLLSVFTVSQRLLLTYSASTRQAIASFLAVVPVDSTRTPQTFGKLMNEEEGGPRVVVGSHLDTESSLPIPTRTWRDRRMGRSGMKEIMKESKRGSVKPWNFGSRSLGSAGRGVVG